MDPCTMATRVLRTVLSVVAVASGGLCLFNLRPLPGYRRPELPDADSSVDLTFRGDLLGQVADAAVEQVELQLRQFGKGPAAESGAAESYTSRLHAVHRRVLPEVANDSVHALAAIRATKLLQQRMSLSGEEVAFRLPLYDLSLTRVGSACPSHHGAQYPVCDPAAVYRSPDGTCNNMQFSWWGSARSPFVRWLPPDYGDSVSSPRLATSGASLPSSRQVSAACLSQPLVTSNLSHSISLMVMQWGQFLDHDLSHTPMSAVTQYGTPITCCGLPSAQQHPDCYPIPIPKRDSLYRQFGQTCMEFLRSVPAVHNGCGLGPREQVNQVTSFIDGSNIYGSSAAELERLRQLENGQLKMAGTLLPPSADQGSCVIQRRDVSCFHAGDIRVNENPDLTTLHTLWVREHNRVAGKLSRHCSSWNDQRLFQESRRLVTAMLQHVTYSEWLPLVLGEQLMTRYQLNPLKRGHFQGYSPNVDATIGNVFAAGAMRFGHTLVPDQLMLFTPWHSKLAGISLQKSFFRPHTLYHPGRLDEYTAGLANANSSESDNYLVDTIRNRLFAPLGAGFGLDLGALNIQRGRDHGLPSYLEWRRACLLTPEITGFAELKQVMNPLAVARLITTYKDVEDIDLYVGGLLEAPLEGALVGPTLGCLVAHQFSQLRRGDRFWYENGDEPHSFTEEQLSEIRKVTLSKLICDNSALATIQPSIMMKPGEGNARVKCRRLPGLNLRTWAEQLGCAVPPSPSWTAGTRPGRPRPPPYWPAGYPSSWPGDRRPTAGPAQGAAPPWSGGAQEQQLVGQATSGQWPGIGQGQWGGGGQVGTPVSDGSGQWPGVGLGQWGGGGQAGTPVSGGSTQWPGAGQGSSNQAGQGVKPGSVQGPGGAQGTGQNPFPYPMFAVQGQRPVPSRPIFSQVTPGTMEGSQGPGLGVLVDPIPVEATLTPTPKPALTSNDTQPDISKTNSTTQANQGSETDRDEGGDLGDMIGTGPMHMLPNSTGAVHGSMSAQSGSEITSVSSEQSDGSTEEVLSSIESSDSQEETISDQFKPPGWVPLIPSKPSGSTSPTPAVLGPSELSPVPPPQPTQPSMVQIHPPVLPPAPELEVQIEPTSQPSPKPDSSKPVHPPVFPPSRPIQVIPVHPQVLPPSPGGTVLVDPTAVPPPTSGTIASVNITTTAPASEGVASVLPTLLPPLTAAPQTEKPNKRPISPPSAEGRPPVQSSVLPPAPLPGLGPDQPVSPEPLPSTVPVQPTQTMMMMMPPTTVTIEPSGWTLTPGKPLVIVIPGADGRPTTLTVTPSADMASATAVQPMATSASGGVMTVTPTITSAMTQTSTTAPPTPARPILPGTAGTPEAPPALTGVPSEPAGPTTAMAQPKPSTPKPVFPPGFDPDFPIIPPGEQIAIEPTDSVSGSPEVTVVEIPDSSTLPEPVASITPDQEAGKETVPDQGEGLPPTDSYPGSDTIDYPENYPETEPDDYPDYPDYFPDTHPDPVPDEYPSGPVTIPDFIPETVAAFNQTPSATPLPDVDVQPNPDIDVIDFPSDAAWPAKPAPVATSTSSAVGTPTTSPSPIAILPTFPAGEQPEIEPAYPDYDLGEVTSVWIPDPDVMYPDLDPEISTMDPSQVTPTARPEVPTLYPSVERPASSVLPSMNHTLIEPTQSLGSAILDSSLSAMAENVQTNEPLTGGIQSSPMEFPAESTHPSRGSLTLTGTTQSESEAILPGVTFSQTEIRIPESSFSPSKTILTGATLSTSRTILTGAAQSTPNTDLPWPTFSSSRTVLPGAILSTSRTILTGATLSTSKTILTGATLSTSKTILTGATLSTSKTILTGATLSTSKTILTGATLSTSKTIFTGATLSTSKTILTGATLSTSKTILTGATLSTSKTFLTGATLSTSKTILTGATLSTSKTILTGATLSTSKTNLPGVTFSTSKTNLPGVTLSTSRTILTGVTLSTSRTILTGVTLSTSKTNLPGATLSTSRTTVTGATLPTSGTILTGATLSSSKTFLPGSTFSTSKTNLPGQTLSTTRTILTGATLSTSRTILPGATLSTSETTFSGVTLPTTSINLPGATPSTTGTILPGTTLPTPGAIFPGITLSTALTISIGVKPSISSTTRLPSVSSSALQSPSSIQSSTALVSFTTLTGPVHPTKPVTSKPPTTWITFDTTVIETKPGVHVTSIHPGQRPVIVRPTGSVTPVVVTSIVWPQAPHPSRPWPQRPHPCAGGYPRPGCLPGPVWPARPWPGRPVISIIAGPTPVLPGVHRPGTTITISSAALPLPVRPAATSQLRPHPTATHMVTVQPAGSHRPDVSPPRPWFPAPPHGGHPHPPQHAHHPSHGGHRPHPSRPPHGGHHPHPSRPPHGEYPTPRPPIFVGYPPNQIFGGYPMSSTHDMKPSDGKQPENTDHHPHKKPAGEENPTFVDSTDVTQTKPIGEVKPIPVGSTGSTQIKPLGEMKPITVVSTDLVQTKPIGEVKPIPVSPTIPVQTSPIEEPKPVQVVPEDPVHTKPIGEVKPVPVVPEDLVQTKPIGEVKPIPVVPEDPVQTKPIGEVKPIPVVPEDPVQTKPIGEVNRFQFVPEDPVQTKPIGEVKPIPVVTEDPVQTKPIGEVKPIPVVPEVPIQTKPIGEVKPIPVVPENPVQTKPVGEVSRPEEPMPSVPEAVEDEKPTTDTPSNVPSSQWPYPWPARPPARPTTEPTSTTTTPPSHPGGETPASTAAPAGAIGGSTSHCEAIGAWRWIPGMSQWCTSNCRMKNPPFCPVSHCRCL